MTSRSYAVDYYLGRGPEAEYLGSARHDYGLFPGLPHFMSISLDDYTETDYRNHVASQVGANLPDGYTPGVSGTTVWPHAHADSTGTTWAVCYDKGSVYVYHRGVEMAIIRCNYRRWQPAHIANPGEFPACRSDVDEFVPRKASRFPTFPPATDTEG